MDIWTVMEAFDRGGGADEAALRYLSFLGIDAHVRITPERAALRVQSDLPEPAAHAMETNIRAGTDPLLRHCAAITRPVVTGALNIHHHPALTRAERGYIGGVGERTGLEAGVAIPRTRTGTHWHLLSRRWNAADSGHALRGDSAGIVLCLRVLDATRYRDEVLTPRERQCLELVARGMRCDAMAGDLSLSRRTVEFHLTNARRKLGAATRDAAIARAVALGLITV